MGRLDARAKATGKSTYVADVKLDNMAFAAIARSTMVHARILSIDTSDARAYPGVIGVYTAADVSPNLYGRMICDMPVLAQDRVRFVGERVAAVVAETREIAEAACELIYVDYEELPAVVDLERASLPDAPRIHEAPWTYRHAVVTEADAPNVQGRFSAGDLAAAEKAIAQAAFSVDETYRTVAVHQGHLETWGTIADVQPDGKVRLWATNKSPHRMRDQVAQCLELDPENIEIEPIVLGGDFGGKGSPLDVPLCIELSRLTRRPVRLVLRFSEELTTTNPRHPAIVRVQLGCDNEGNFVGAVIDSSLDGGAYVALCGSAVGVVSGVMESPLYRIPAIFVQARNLYTNRVPKGNMRAPGCPQLTFAVESAIDELAVKSGIPSLELRRRNILRGEDETALGHRWNEYRGEETLEAAVEQLVPVQAPPGWLVGTGMSIFGRKSHAETKTSLRLVPLDEGGLRVEIPVTETGTGSHTVMRRLIAECLEVPEEKVEVAQVSTDDLPDGLAAGGSRVTTNFAQCADAATKAWLDRIDDDPILVRVKEPDDVHGYGSFCVTIAQVAVDPQTGEIRVLEIESAVDVAEIINEKAHQMQIDGGVLMGFGQGCLEDLDEHDGQIWAANLGEFKLPSMRDAPALKTVLVGGAKGIGGANVKMIGELTTPPVPAAIANAVCDATGCRIRELPLTPARVFEAMHGLSPQ